MEGGTLALSSPQQAPTLITKAPAFAAGSPAAPDSASEQPPILLMAAMFPPDNFIGAARPGRFAKYLHRAGYRVDVLAASASAKPVVSGEVHRVRGEIEVYDRRDLAGFLERVARKLFFPCDLDSMWCLRATRYARRFMRNGRRPLVISTAPPVLINQAAWRLKKKFGVAWIADLRDPFTDIPSRERSRRARWLGTHLEKLIFHHADAVIANTDAAAEMWRRRYPQAASRIHVLWNGFDPEDALGPEPVPDRDYTVLVHTGAIYDDRRPDVLLESVERLVRSGALDPQRFRIHLLGYLSPGSVRASKTMDYLQNAGCVHVFPPVSRAEANRIMATSDYLLLLDVFRSAAPVQLPGKTFDYVRVGRPILVCTQHGSPTERVVGMSGIRYVAIAEGDPPEEVDRRVLQFASLLNVPARISEEFRNTFDGSRQVNELCRIIDMVTGREKAAAAPYAQAAWQ